MRPQHTDREQSSEPTVKLGSDTASTRRIGGIGFNSVSHQLQALQWEHGHDAETGHWEAVLAS